jgi:hypothetical protein
MVLMALQMSLGGERLATRAITLGSPSLRPNPQKLLVLARDLIVVARDLTAAG